MIHCDLHDTESETNLCEFQSTLFVWWMVGRWVDLTQVELSSLFYDSDKHKDKAKSKTCVYWFFPCVIYRSQLKKYYSLIYFY